CLALALRILSCDDDFIYCHFVVLSLVFQQSEFLDFSFLISNQAAAADLISCGDTAVCLFNVITFPQRSFGQRTFTSSLAAMAFLGISNAAAQFAQVIRRSRPFSDVESTGRSLATGRINLSIEVRQPASSALRANSVISFSRRVM